MQTQNSNLPFLRRRTFVVSFFALALSAGAFLRAVPFAPVAAQSIAAPSIAAQTSGDVYAIKGATIVTAAGKTIKAGTVVVRNGLIEAVGEGVAVPADARVIEGTGLTVYPGFFDSLTGLGIRTTPPAGVGGATPSADPTQAFLAQMAAPPSTVGLLPEVIVTEQLQVNAETFDAQRAIGITTALTAPRAGIFQGQSALINLGGDAAEKLVLKAPASLNVAFATARGSYPNSLMGAFAFLRQTLLDAQHYRDEWARYQKNPRGLMRPQLNKSLAALQPYLSGELPVILMANSEREIRRAVALGEEFKLNFMIAGAAQAARTTDVLKAKNVPVLLSLAYPQRPQGLEDPEDESLRALRERAEAPKAAAALQQAGVKFAFTSGTLARPQDFLVNLQRAIEAGLSPDAALQALTSTPAEMFGVSAQLGTIEKGKIANLVLASGDIFKKETKVKHVLVDGRLFDIKAEPARPAGGPTAGGARGGAGAATATGAAVVLAGMWNIQINAPIGTQQGTLRLEQNGETISGELSSPLGTAPLKNGTLRGNEIRFDFSLVFQGQQLDINATGKVDGATLAGTMSAMGQTFEFNGSKRPN